MILTSHVRITDWSGHVLAENVINSYLAIGNVVTLFSAHTKWKKVHVKITKISSDGIFKGRLLTSNHVIQFVIQQIIELPIQWTP